MPRKAFAEPKPDAQLPFSDDYLGAYFDTQVAIFPYYLETLHPCIRLRVCIRDDIIKEAIMAICQTGNEAGDRIIISARQSVAALLYRVEGHTIIQTEAVDYGLRFLAHQEYIGTLKKQRNPNKYNQTLEKQIEGEQRRLVKMCDVVIKYQR